ncbi:MAG: hypothetical protein M3503_01030 [Actinomycetota bacterium]|nr:hypothetical protein [Actinomycetota bacterium]
MGSARLGFTRAFEDFVVRLIVGYAAAAQRPALIPPDRRTERPPLDLPLLAA